MNHGKVDDIKEENPIPAIDAFRQEALALADHIGVAVAARELSLHSS